MFGYILASIIGLVVIGFAFSALGGGSSPARTAGPHSSRGEKPIQPDDPAADEPTPDRSLIASTEEIETAKRHTPPA